MRTATLRKILNRKEGAIQKHVLYLVRAEGVVLYIGQSKNPLHRLREHVALTGRGTESQLGELIFYNLPVSLSWLVQLMTLKECFNYVKQAFSDNHTFDWYTQPYDEKQAKDAAEIALIRRFNPCLNATQNLTATPLPATIVDPFKLSSVPSHPNPRAYLKQLLAA